MYRLVEFDGNVKNFKIITFQGEEGFVVKFADSCSGCYETEDGHPVGDYGPPHPVHGCGVGSGCRECGYRGWKMRKEWVPCDQ